MQCIAWGLQLDAGCWLLDASPSLPICSTQLHCSFGCRDGDHKLTKGDVLGAVGPLMSVAQAGVVIMGSSHADSRKAASVWEDFRDSMRELATDKVAAAIATGAFDEVDAHHTGRIQGGLSNQSALFTLSGVFTLMLITTLNIQCRNLQLLRSHWPR